MVKSLHEASHRIFQDRPEILTPVFKVLDIELPEKATVDVVTGDVTETRPLSRHVDSVLLIQPADGEAFLLAIEAQGKRDPDKETSWPYYVAYLRERYGIPVLLLVLCHQRSTAKWAVGPFTCGARKWTAQSTHPLVIGPDNVPMITEPRAIEENLAMAAFTAITHSGGRGVTAILEPLARAVHDLDRDSAAYWGEFLEIGLRDTPAGAKWSELMTVASFFPGRGTVRETAFLEGEAQGEANSILRILDLRGVDVPDEIRDRIRVCTDLDLLGRWLDRTVTAQTIDDLFADGATPDSA
ncbi:hypothetical protein [Streptomyces sp. NPDC050738]|uniref:hypothetical protein n=1 Tax=Streptomyces sp. NPDC050738 TaxID=3154744 RepID=UPI003412CC05